jgi:hypothetical protein
MGGGGGRKMSGNGFEQTTYEKWQKWFDIIYEEIQALSIYRDVYREVQKLIKANPKIQKPSSFYDFLDIAYTAFAAMSIRRQIKIKNDSISFARLLSDMKKHPEIMSRDRFVALYKATSDKDCGVEVLQKHLENRPLKTFRKYSDSSGSQFNPEIADHDLQGLKATAEKIEKFADKRIAHYDKSMQKTPATFKDLDDSVDFLENLLKKYCLLFRAESLLNYPGTYQYDWKEIFRYPWIEHKGRSMDRAIKSDLLSEEVDVVEESRK